MTRFFVSIGCFILRAGFVGRAPERAQPVSSQPKSLRARLETDASGSRESVHLEELAPISIRSPGEERPFCANRLALSPDGKMLAVGDAWCRIRLLNVASRTEEARFKLDSDDLRGFVFSSDSQTLIAAGRDTSIAMWGVKSKRQRFHRCGDFEKIVRVAPSAD